MKTHYSTGEAADKFGCQAWRLNYLFNQGILPKPPRVAGRALIPADMLPKIRAALESRGWLKQEAATAYRDGQKSRRNQTGRGVANRCVPRAHRRW